MTKRIEITFQGSGYYTIRNLAGAFDFLSGLQKRDLFERMSIGPQMTAHALPSHRIEKFVAYAEKNGVEIIRTGRFY